MEKKAEQKKIGRPSIPESRKKVKPSITLDPKLLQEAKAKAASMEMGLSEWVTRALHRQIGRDEDEEAERNGRFLLVKNQNSRKSAT